MTAPSDTPNAAMIEYWNEDGGRRFIQTQERLDDQIGPVGRVVIERVGVRPGEAILDVGCGCGQSSCFTCSSQTPCAGNEVSHSGRASDSHLCL